MDYLKDAQKVHEMAKSMVTNGLALNINEALRALQSLQSLQTNEINNRAGNSTNSSNSNQQNQIDQVNQTKEVKMEDKTYEERLMKIESFLQRFDKFFSKFYEDTTKKFNDLNKELIEMKTKMDNQPVRSISSSSNTSASIARPVQEKPVNQRVGSFTPADVNINDIFSNAGNKMMKR